MERIKIIFAVRSNCWTQIRDQIREATQSVASGSHATGNRTLMPEWWWLLLGPTDLECTWQILKPKQ